MKLYEDYDRDGSEANEAELRREQADADRLRLYEDRNGEDAVQFQRDRADAAERAFSGLVNDMAKMEYRWRHNVPSVHDCGAARKCAAELLKVLTEHMTENNNEDD